MRKTNEEDYRDHHDRYSTCPELRGMRQCSSRNRDNSEYCRTVSKITELDSAPQEMLPPEFKRIIKVTAEGKLYYVGIGKGDEADEYYVGNIVSSDGVLIKSLIK